MEVGGGDSCVWTRGGGAMGVWWWWWWEGEGATKRGMWIGYTATPGTSFRHGGVCGVLPLFAKHPG
jgi:hypothetical protein